MANNITLENFNSKIVRDCDSGSNRNDNTAFMFSHSWWDKRFAKLNERAKHFEEQRETKRLKEEEKIKTL